MCKIWHKQNLAILVTLAWLSAISPSLAQPQTPSNSGNTLASAWQPTHSSAEKKAAENYDSQRISSLPIWQDMNAKDLISLYDKMGTKSDSPAIRSLALSLLTAPPAVSPKEPLTAQQEQALLNIRLNKLLQWGDLDQTVNVYRQYFDNPETEFNVSLAKATYSGITAMLAKGETGTACLDHYAMTAVYDAKKPLLWMNVDLLCKILTGPTIIGNNESQRFTNAARTYLEAGNVKVKTPQTIDDLNGTSPVNIMALGVTGRLNQLLANADAVKALDNQSLALLRERGPKEPAIYLRLLSESARRGMLDAIEIKSRLQPFLAEYEKDKSYTKSDGYINFINQYINLNTWPDYSFIHQTKSILGSTDILIPIIKQKAIEEQNGNEDPMPWDWFKTSPEESRQILSLLLRANHSVNRPLVERAFPDYTENQNGLSQKQSTDIKTLLQALLAEQNQTKAQNMAETLAIQPYLEGNSPDIKTKKRFYDNIFNLTESGNYVMPSGDILSNLKEIAKKKPSVQVVIESVDYLTQTPRDKIHPAILFGILDVFNSVGLSVKTKALGHEVLGSLLEN